MKVTKEQLDKVRVALTIEVDDETFKKAIKEAYQKEKGRINIPGFRKGKAPLQIIEQHYGKDIFYGDAAESVVYPAYAEAIKEEALEPIGPPDFDIVTLEVGKPFVFKAEVDLKQDIDLGDYKNVIIEGADTKVTEEEIDQYIARVQENTALLETLEGEDAKVADGDVTIIDFEGKKDDVPFEGGTATDHELQIGSGSFIPGFEEKMIGMKLGETKDIELTFPENYHAEDLAGQEVVFTVTVKEIKRKELAPLDDEFAKDVSEFDTLDEYKTSVGQELKEEKEKQAKEKNKAELSRKITEQTDVIAPKSLVNQEAENYVKEMTYNLEQQGINMDLYLQLTGSTEEDLKKQAEEQAEKAVAQQLVLEAIAEAEGLEVTDEELDAEYERLAEHYKMEVDKIKQIFMIQGQADAVRQNMLMEKTIDMLLETGVQG